MKYIIFFITNKLIMPILRLYLVLILFASLVILESIFLLIEYLWSLDKKNIKQILWVFKRFFNKFSIHIKRLNKNFPSGYKTPLDYIINKSIK